MENQNQTTKPKPRKPKTNRTIVPVFLASAAIFASVAGFLGVQVASGQDPMLGAKTTTAQSKNVIVRKVIKTRKIVTVVDAPATGATSTGNGAVYASSGGGSSYSAPAQSYSAPVQSAPAPAPVQTATS